MHRVMIIGQPGSGKSTFALRLGAVTRLPVFHMDHIHWKPGWVPRALDEKAALCHEVQARQQWIFEGGHSATWADRLARADTLIWLDVGLIRRLWRVTRRTILHYGRTRPDLPDNCPEHFSWEFYRYIWRTRRSSRARMARLVALKPPKMDVLVLRSPREVEDYLTDVARAMDAGALGLPHR